jgi:hypothetical protein
MMKVNSEALAERKFLYLSQSLDLMYSLPRPFAALKLELTTLLLLPLMEPCGHGDEEVKANSVLAHEHPLLLPFKFLLLSRLETLFPTLAAVIASALS